MPFLGAVKIAALLPGWLDCRACRAAQLLQHAHALPAQVRAAAFPPESTAALGVIFTHSCQTGVAQFLLAVSVCMLLGGACLGMD